MMGLGALALLALAFGGAGSAAASSDSGARNKPKPTPKRETDAQRTRRVAAKITEESAEIIHGKRDDFSEDPELVKVVNQVDKKAAAPDSDMVNEEPDSDEALSLAIKEAVEAADRAARETEATGVQEPVAEPDDPDEVVAPAPAPQPEQAQEDIAEVTQVTQPISSPTVEPAPTPSTIPAGYDPDGARRMAPSLARHLKNKGRAGYDRRLMQEFQRKAGITADKIYGGESAGAVRYYGGTDAPNPFFPPLQVVPYKPPA